MPALDFDPESMPWADRDSFPQEADRRVAGKSLDPGDLAVLMRWRHDGYLALPRAIGNELVDSLLEDCERAGRTRPAIKALVSEAGVQPFAELGPRTELSHHPAWRRDFQDSSEAARRVMFHPEIIRHLRLIFDAPPVAIQSLFFEYGTQHPIRQDFPYIQAQNLSFLVGCWVALEDVTAENGPLFYYPGSHRLPKYDWGDGRLVWDGRSRDQISVFEAALARRCDRAGLIRETFHAAKGDVFLWHAALAYGGSRTLDAEATRKSLVAHYSTREAYPRDRRWPDREPEVLEIGGGYLYLPRETPKPPGILRRLRSILGGLVGRFKP